MGSTGAVHRNLKQAGKTIGINQRIPVIVLDRAVIRFLKTGRLDRQEVLNDLAEHFEGINRRIKGYRIVSRMVGQMKSFRLNAEVLSAEAYLNLSDADKFALLLCLIVSAYPFGYELLCTLSSGFKAQNRLNASFLMEKMGNVYGGNRAAKNAVYALVPMMLELGVFERVKIALYGSVPVRPISNPRVAEIYVFTDILLSGSKSIRVEDMTARQWYFFYYPEAFSPENLRLLKISETGTAGGYLTIGRRQEQLL